MPPRWLHELRAGLCLAPGLSLNSLAFRFSSAAVAVLKKVLEVRGEPRPPTFLMSAAVSYRSAANHMESLMS